MIGRLLLALGLLLLVAGSATAQNPPTGTVQLRFADLERLDATVEAEYVGDAARNERTRIDADRDGSVSEEEAEGAAQRQVELASNTRMGLPIGRVYLDRVENSASQVLAVDYAGAVGPASSDGSLVITWWLALTWPMNASAEAGGHLFEIDTQNFSVGGYLRLRTGFVLLESPPGYKIGDTGGLPFGADVEARRILMPTGTGGSGWIRVAFVPAPAQESPSAPLPGLLLACGAALAWMRRGRV